MVHNEKNKDTI